MSRSLKGIYQDEFRRLRHASRSELLRRRQGHVPQPRQHDRGPLRPRRDEAANFNTCAIINPGSDSPLGARPGPGLQRPRQPAGPDKGCFLLGTADRRGQADVLGRRARRPQAVHQRPVGAGVRRVLEPEGQLRRRGPRGPRPDRPRHQRRLRLLRVPAQQRGQLVLDRQPGPPRRGIQRPVGSVRRSPVLRPHGQPTSINGYYNSSTRRSSTWRSAGTRDASRPTTR